MQFALKTTVFSESSYGDSTLCLSHFWKKHLFEDKPQNKKIFSKERLECRLY